MTDMAMADWRDHERRRRATWRDTFVAGGIAGALVGAAAAVASPWRAGLLIGGIAAAAVAVARGTVGYLARVDEQERDANLWGCYVGMCLYLVLFLGEQAARLFGAALPHADWAIFAATIATVLAVFIWRRYR